MAKMGLLRYAVMGTGLIFFFFVSKIGVLNRLMLTLVGCQGMVFLVKGRFYSQVINDALPKMSLAGQEAWIQMRYNFPEHPDKEQMEANCVEYKKKSEE